MRSTTRKLQSVQQALWRLRYRVERNFDLLLEARELFWLELELRTELRTDQIRLVRGNSVSHVHYFLKNPLPITSFHNLVNNSCKLFCHQRKCFYPELLVYEPPVTIQLITKFFPHYWPHEIVKKYFNYCQHTLLTNSQKGRPPQE